MFHFGHFHKRFLIVDSIDDPVVANSNAPLAVATFEFFAPGRSRRNREIFDFPNDPGDKRRGKPVYFLCCARFD